MEEDVRWREDNAETLQILIHNHMMNIDEARRGRKYEEWYNELNALFDDVVAKLVKKKKYDEDDDVDLSILGAKTEPQPKKKKKSKKLDVEKTYSVMCDKFEKIKNEPRFLATYLGRTNNPQSHAVLNRFLRSMTRWIYKQMEKAGLSGVSYSNEY